MCQIKQYLYNQPNPTLQPHKGWSFLITNNKLTMEIIQPTNPAQPKNQKLKELRKTAKDGKAKKTNLLLALGKIADYLKYQTSLKVAKERGNAQITVTNKDIKELIKTCALNGTYRALMDRLLGAGILRHSKTTAAYRGKRKELAATMLARNRYEFILEDANKIKKFIKDYSQKASIAPTEN